VTKIEPLIYGDRKVFPVSAFNRGVAIWLRKLPEVWVEGELSELRRNDSWGSVFFTLKDPQTGATLAASMRRLRFDALELELNDGEKVHVQGRPELYEQKGELAFRATTIERFGLGEHLAALERLKRALAGEGLFAAERKRRLPRFPRAVGVLTGADAAARGDIVTAIRTRFPPACLVVAETRVQGAGAPSAILRSLAELAAHPQVDVVVVTRGGGSFEDLLPFSDERVVRAFAACPIPVVSAVGHEQDTPLCDLAADVRASTPTAAARLVVPDLDELLAGLSRSKERLATGLRRLLDRDRERLTRTQERLGAAPRLLLERRRAALHATDGRLRALSPRATVERGYAIVRSHDVVLGDATVVDVGETIDIELAKGSLAATVDEVTTP
jgi:exodeoxyribonuclease VII large subunit